MDNEEVVSLLKELKINDLEFEDWSSEESPNHKLLSSELIGINFCFDDNLLSEIQWRPLFIDDDTIRWLG